MLSARFLPLKVPLVYQPCALYRRTPAERGDQVVSWAREDQAFFAACACHILAFAFTRIHPEADFSIVALRKVGEPHAFHVYVSNGTWAFDHAGWAREAELLSVTATAEFPAQLEKLRVDGDLRTFCVDQDSRPPHLYAHAPWQRAYDYIASFTPPPEFQDPSPRRTLGDTASVH
jgi:hypothetical protein